MKKFTSAFAFILIVFSFVLILGACSENSTGPDESELLVGTWDLTKMISEYEGETETISKNQIDEMGLIWTLNIDDGGTVKQITNISGPLLTMPGTWSTTKNQLILVLKGPTGSTGTMTYNYALEGNILKLSWALPPESEERNLNAEFTKQ